MQVNGVVVIKNKLLETRIKKLLAGAGTFANSTDIVHVLSRNSTEAQSVFSQIYDHAVMVGPGSVSGPFKATVLPVLYEIGTVIFWCSCVYGFYYIMRKNLKEGSARIKWAAIGYICLRCLEVFTKMVETVATNMLKGM